MELTLQLLNQVEVFRIVPYSLNILSFPLMILIHIFQCYLLYLLPV